MFVVGLGLGWWLDDLAHTTPAFTLLGMLLGLAVAGTYLYREMSKTLKQ